MGRPEIYINYKELENKFEVHNSSSMREYVNYSNYENYPIHRWFRYREGFSLELVEEYLDNDDSLVLDPFCGSGTTLLTAQLQGIPSVGFEINPLASFVSKMKTRRLTPEERKKFKSLIPKVLDISLIEASEKPGLSLIHKAFNKEILQTLLKVKSKIYDLQEGHIRDMFKFAWLSVLEGLSNTKKEGNGIKYRFTKRRKEGYVQLPQKEWEDDYFGSNKKDLVLSKLEEKFNQIVTDCESYPTSDTSVNVFTESALEMTKFVTKNVSKTVFSPPYVNCFDYFEIFKIELWMGDFVKSYRESRELKRQAISSNTNTNFSEFSLKLPELDNFIQDIDEDELWDNNIIDMIRAYFQEMSQTLQEIFQLSSVGSKIVIVVGNSAYTGTIIPTDLLLSRIGQILGYSNIKLNVVRHLTTSSQQRKLISDRLKPFLRESIIIMEKTA